MNFKYPLILFVFLILASNGNAQSSDSQFSQFIITNLDSREKAIEIDEFMRAIPGIEISRADINSKKYLCIYAPSYNITRLSFEKWMKELGIEFKCYREGKFGTDKILDQKFNCE